MSHFICVTVSKKNQNPEDLLKPFDENLEVPEYKRDCYCKIHNLNTKVNKELEIFFGGNFDEVIRKPYNNLNTILAPKWADYVKPYFKKEEELKLLYKNFKVSDPRCETCKGTGIETVSYNPNSKWDWYSMGGRWTGYFKLKKGAKGNLGNSGVFNNPPREGYVDQAYFKDIDWKGMIEDDEKESEEIWDKAQKLPVNEREWQYGIKKGYTKEEFIKNRISQIPYAFIDYLGVWHEKAEMGWWAVETNNREDDYKKEWKLLLKNIKPDDLLTAWDLHI